MQCCQQNFSDENLLFYFDSWECIAREHSNVLLAKNLLLDFSYPYKMLDNFFHDLPMILSGSELITIQRADPNIYKAVVCFLFLEQCILGYFDSQRFILQSSYRSVMHDLYEFRSYVSRR